MKNSFLILIILAIYFQNSNGIYFLLTEGKEKCIYDEIPDEEVKHLISLIFCIYINFYFLFKKGCEIRILINGCFLSSNS